MSIRETFVDAYNRRDLAGLAALLHEDAVAEVVNSGFPEQAGRDAVRDGALAYVLGDPGLVAELSTEVLFRQAADGALEMVAVIEERDGRIGRIAFHTMAHDPEGVAAYISPS